MLVQQLRRWPTLNQHLVNVPCRVGWESSYFQYAGRQLFLDPHGNITVCVSTQSRHKRNRELFTHRCRSSI